jgi:hypothetical protein
MTPNATAPAPAWPWNDGSLEALKWLALVAMTLDHANTYLMHPREPVLYAIGRLAFPLFAFVLAVNLARPGALARGVHWRVALRLALFGALALVPFTLLWQQRWGWWPLNILFTLLVATLVIALIERGGATRWTAAALLFALGGALVDYLWPGIALTVAAWAFARRQTWPRVLAIAVCVVSLSLLAWLLYRTPPAHSAWALVALPLIALTAYVNVPVPRLRWLFYGYYPAHLLGIWLWRTLA